VEQHFSSTRYHFYGDEEEDSTITGIRNPVVQTVSKGKVVVFLFKYQAVKTYWGVEV
jgi:hypothetical protein